MRAGDPRHEPLGAHLDALAAKLDAFERRQVASELTTGVFVTSAQAFLKLGIGTTVFVGATLLVSGQTDFMTYFASCSWSRACTIR
mgnify:CR=1 FL=1